MLQHPTTHDHEAPTLHHRQLELNHTVMDSRQKRNTMMIELERDDQELRVTRGASYERAKNETKRGVWQECWEWEQCESWKRRSGRQRIWFRVRGKKEIDLYIASQNYIVLLRKKKTTQLSINCILGKIKNTKQNNIILYPNDWFLIGSIRKPIRKMFYQLLNQKSV